MTLYCPVTGLKVFTEPEWINQKVSDTLTDNNWMIGSSILYSLPKGHADLKGVQNALTLHDKIARFVSKGKGPYIQIEDYAFLSGASISTRRFFTNRYNNDKRLLSIIFCNLSPQLSIAVKIGKRFNTTGKYVHVTKNYQDAIRRALELCDQENLKQDASAIELNKFFTNNERFLVPVDVLSDDAWKIQTQEFSNNSVVIDQCILHSTAKGYLEPKHVTLIDHLRDMYQSAVSADSSIKYIIVDSSRLIGGSRLARAKYMQSLKNWHKRYPLRMYIMYGANTFMKTALHLAKPLMPFKVRIAKDFEHACHMIRNDRSDDFSKNKVIPASKKPAMVMQEDIEKLMALISRINWEQEGIHNSLDIREDHPLFFLYQSIKLIKEELDDIFKERNQLEGQLRQSLKMESIGTVSGGIAHDFNSILGIILANTEMVLTNVHEIHPAHSNLQDIKKACLRASKIISQLLNFSRKSKLELKPIDAIAVIKDALQFVRSTIPTTIEIRKHLPDSDTVILADPIEINQLLMNICNNASQAMEEGGGILEINVETSALTKDEGYDYSNLTDGDYLIITISDTGFGIEPEIIDKIFDPYFTTKEVGKGSGMGLAVAHGIVKNHGGNITVDSQPGKGTKFTILLPVTTEKPAIDVKGPDETPHGNETILFVDDERDFVKIGKRALESLGYEVIACTSSLEALELFKARSNHIDLVIVDITMPNMPGDKLAEELIRIKPEIPVILCTAYSTRIKKEKALNMGIRAFLLKPLQRKDLAQAIRNVLDEK